MKEGAKYLKWWPSKIPVTEITMSTFLDYVFGEDDRNSCFGLSISMCGDLTTIISLGGLQNIPSIGVCYVMWMYQIALLLDSTQSWGAFECCNSSEIKGWENCSRTALRFYREPQKNLDKTLKQTKGLDGCNSRHTGTSAYQTRSVMRLCESMWRGIELSLCGHWDWSFASWVAIVQLVLNVARIEVSNVVNA